MQQWEYKLVLSDGGLEITVVDNKELKEKPLPRTFTYLNQLGREGWEVVGFSAHGNTRDYVLKRPLLIVEN